MTIKAMHDRHKLNKAMSKFREGLSEMAAVDPENPENNSISVAVKDLEESVDYWLEEVDKVPEVTFAPGPWTREGRLVVSVGYDDGDCFTVACDVEDSEAALIVGAPDLAYAAYKAWRCLEMRDLKEKEREAIDGLAVALRGCGVAV